MKNVTSLLWLMLSVLFFSCSTEEDKSAESISNNEIMVFVGDTYTLTCTSKNPHWSSDNALIASVQTGSDPVTCIVSGKHVGETIVRAGNNLKCKVTVMPKVISFTEPHIDFGTSLSTIKERMANNTILRTNSTSSDYSITYSGTGKISSYSYVFSSSSNSAGLKASLFQISLRDAEELMDFLLERHIPMTHSGDEYYFRTIDEKCLICYTLSSNPYVTYIPYPD